MSNVNSGNRSHDARAKYEVAASATERYSRASSFSEVASVNNRIMLLIDQIIGEQNQMRSLVAHLGALREALNSAQAAAAAAAAAASAARANASQAQAAATAAQAAATTAGNALLQAQASSMGEGGISVDVEGLSVAASAATASLSTASATASAANAAASAAEAAASAAQAAVSAIAGQIAEVEQELKECIERIAKLQSQIDRLRAVDLPAAERRDRERMEQQRGASASGGSGSTAGEEITVAVDAAKAELRRAQSLLGEVRAGVMAELEPLAQVARNILGICGDRLNSGVRGNLESIIAMAERLGAAETSNVQAGATVRRDGFAVPTRNVDTAVTNFVRGGGRPGGSGIGI